MIYEACHRASDWFVGLCDEQVNEFAAYGMRRHRAAAEHELQHYHYGEPVDAQSVGTEEYFARSHALGALGEGIVRGALNFPLELTMGPQGFGQADIPEADVEVKVMTQDHYGLRVFADMQPDWRVVAVMILKGKERGHPYRLPGWYRAGDALIHAEWKLKLGREPLWCVPQCHLRPLIELRRILESEGHACCSGYQ